MLALYCFASDEERRALFTEAAMRGFVAAVRDWPRRLKESDVQRTMATAAAAVLRADVCCIQNEAVYVSLLYNAWLIGYSCTEYATERETAYCASIIKAGSVEEAWAVIRPLYG